MTTRQNPMAGRYFNDPNFAAAVSNLAGAFAPPSPEEYLTAEKVKGLRTTNSALADFYSMANGDPDMLGVAADLFDPVNGFEAMRNVSADKRYATDVGANTALATNAADNERATRVALLGAAADPDGRQALDEDLLAAIMPGMNVPGLSEAQPVAPTLEEVRGRIALQGRDDLTGDDIYALTMGSTPTEEIVTPQGPRLTFGSVAARDGAEPFVNPGSTAAPDLLNYRTADGREGTAVFDPSTQKLTDAASGAELPQGTTTYKLQGGDKAAVSGATTSNTTRGNEIVAEASYGKERAAKFLQLIENNDGVLGVPGMIRGFAQDVLAGVNEFGEAYGAIENMDELQAVAAQVAQSRGYTPEIAQAFNYALEMAYLAANMQDPGGEVGIRELAMNMDQYDGGIAGNEKVKANLAVLIGQLDDRIAYGNALRTGDDFVSPNPAGAAAPTASATATPGQSLSPEALKWIEGP